MSILSAVRDGIHSLLGGNLNVRARYDAAQTTPENTRHWGQSTNLDAILDNSSGTRLTLRKRARYEVKNNSYAYGIVDTVSNDTVGIGPKLQVMSTRPELNTQIELAFSQWCKSIGFAEKLRLMKKSKTRDGEIFALKITNKNLKGVTLDFMPIEAEMVDTPIIRNTKNGTGWNDGIQVDTYGYPKRYFVYDEHPNGPNASLSAGKPVNASSVIHWFKKDRAGQIRGVPEITPALPLFAFLRRYTLAVVAAAELAAEYTMFLKTQQGVLELGEAQAGEAFATFESERGMVTTLPDGWDINQLRAEQPTTTYPDFKHELINEIARCLNIPYNIAACNSSSYNYASGRLDHQTYYKSIRIEQEHCEDIILDNLFASWFAEYRLIKGLTAEMFNHSWMWEGHEHIDPLKEANAQTKRLDANTTTLKDEYARLGKDWEEQLKQRAKEKQLIRDLKIDVTDDDGGDNAEDKK